MMLDQCSYTNHHTFTTTILTTSLGLNPSYHSARQTDASTLCIVILACLRAYVRSPTVAQSVGTDTYSPWRGWIWQWILRVWRRSSRKWLQLRKVGLILHHLFCKAKGSHLVNVLQDLLLVQVFLVDLQELIQHIALLQHQLELVILLLWLLVLHHLEVQIMLLVWWSAGVTLGGVNQIHSLSSQNLMRVDSHYSDFKRARWLMLELEIA